MIKSQKWRFWPLITLAAVTTLSACDQDDRQRGAIQPVSVEVITVKTRPFAHSSELPGRIEPVRVAEVRARVSGIILSRHFEEGADVKAGDVLFRIDPRPFQAALARAEGELARAEAALHEASAVVRRYAPLVRIDAVSQQDYDAAQAALQRAQADRKSARASIETARLDLEYATVTAPISGRVGRALVTEGALVGQGEATPLALIQQLDPIYADFRQPVADMLRLRAALSEGQIRNNDESRGAPVSITLEGSGETREGHLIFSDITVDRNTGQVSLRGQFDNHDGLLLPGMYVRVRTPQGVDPQAILLPQRAVRRGLDGRAQVLVVNNDSTAQPRDVVTGVMEGAEWQILSGLQPGEKVIVGGAAQPGAPVTVASATTADPGNKTTPAREQGH